METVKYNYSKLKGKVREIFGNNKVYADYLCLSEASLYEKYKSNSYFNQNQIEKTLKAFNESPEMIMAYFFTKEVENNSTNQEEGG